MPSSTSSNYCFNKQMKHLLEGETFDAPSSLWLALFTTAPALTGSGGVEVSTVGTGYGRQELVSTDATWNGPSGTHQEYSNANDITFGVPTANWGTITAGGLFDAETGGNLMYVVTLATPNTVNNGDGAPRVLVNQLKISRAAC